jgi:hypothetical protein
MPETISRLVSKSDAAKVLRKEAVEAKRLPDGFKKPEDGDWVCMSAEVPPEDESAGDVVRVAGISTDRHTDKSPIKLLGQHMRGTGDGSPAVIGRMEEFRLGKKSWKGKQVPALFGRFSWAKDGEGKVTELAAKYKALWDGGYLDSVSIGFRPTKSRALNAEKPWDGYEFLESELVELSIVTIPANPAATVLRHIADAFEEKSEKKDDPVQRSEHTVKFQMAIDEALVGALDRFEKRINALLDDIECSVVAKSDEAEQTGDHDAPRAPDESDKAHLSKLADALDRVLGRATK